MKAIICLLLTITIGGVIIAGTGDITTSYYQQTNLTIY